MNNRHKYPKNWKALALACKDAAGWRCQECKVPHGTIRVSYSGRPWPVFLVAAHKLHDPFNPSPDLACVCPRCHWKFYRRHGQPAVWVIERLKIQRVRGKLGGAR